MQTHNLIASVVAVLITTVSLGVLNYGITNHPVTDSGTQGLEVINLAPVNVTPTAEERRAAALLTKVDISDIAPASPSLMADATDDMPPLSLVSASLSMPYYSFSNKYGRISKE